MVNIKYIKGALNLQTILLLSEQKTMDKDQKPRKPGYQRRLEEFNTLISN